MKFEEGLGDLEGIVERLEAAELPLEEALSLFEKGVGLVRELSKQLDDVERKLEILTRNAVGEVELREMSEASAASGGASRDVARDVSEDPPGDD